MLIRFAIVPIASFLLFACTPGGAGSEGDSSAGSETGAVPGSTSGSTGEPVTSGSTSTGGDPTTSTGGSTTSTTTDTTSTSTTDATTTTTTDTTTSTTDASTGTTGDASTGGDGLGPDAQAAIDALTEAVDGVIWPSESDYPWKVFGLPKAAPVTIDNVKMLVGDLVEVEDVEPPLAEQGVEEEPWEDRFIIKTSPQPWWTDYEYMLAEQYELIRTTLKTHLVDIKLFRIGPDNGNVLYGGIDMFVIGETADGDLVGIQTVSVET